MMRNPSQAASKHRKSVTGARPIIALLEVIDSDTASMLVKGERQEQDAQSRYERSTQENRVIMVQHKKTLAYKSQEHKTMSVALTEHASNKESADALLAAVGEYDAKLKDRCIAKPDTFEERIARRRAEIAGLEQALASL